MTPSTMKTTLFTIGHSRHPADRFVTLLRTAGVTRLVDVRSQPASRWTPHFGKAALARLLEAAAIDYVFLGRELGGRPVGTEYYGPDGALDHARRAEAADFKAGIDQLVALARERPTAILCAEEDPARCHRRLLVTPALRRAGLAVVHLRGDGRVEDDPADQLGLFR